MATTGMNGRPGVMNIKVFLKQIKSIIYEAIDAFWILTYSAVFGKL